MNYQNITKDDMKNGDGLRVVLWVSGCDHHCKGCQNPVTWDATDGLPFNDDAMIEIGNELSKDYVSGITFSGGDPLYYTNIKDIALLCVWVKLHFPEKTIWLYTGYTWEQIMDKKDNVPITLILSCIDVMVDGRFEIDKLDVNYPWAGSWNQRVIDVQKSLKEGAVFRHESN